MEEEEEEEEEKEEEEKEEEKEEEEEEKVEEKEGRGVIFKSMVTMSTMEVPKPKGGKRGWWQ